MSKDHSEPAFPSNSHEYGPVLGLSIRDYFAAKALPIVAERFNMQFDEDGSRCISPMSFQSIAHDAYQLAEAMLEERAK